MSKQSFTVKEYLEMARKEFVAIATGLFIGFFVCSFEPQAIASSFQNTTSIETLDSDSVTTESIQPSKSGKIEISLNSNVQTTEEKMDVAYAKLNLDDNVYDPVYSCLRESLKRISINKVTADIDSDSQSLEFVFLIEKELLVSVSKPLETISDNKAIVTFIYQREVIYSNLVDLSTLSSHINSIGEKLKKEVNAD